MRIHLACLLLAEAGNPHAQFNLGLLYENGLGVPADGASQYNVGLFYATGRGIAPSDVQAVAWLTVAHENGAPDTELLGKLRKHMAASSLQEAERLVEDVRRQCRVP